MRVDHRRAAPAALNGMLALEKTVHESTLEPALLELVKLCAAQINGWNRRAVGLRAPVGDCVSPHAPSGSPQGGTDGARAP